MTRLSIALGFFCAAVASAQLTPGFSTYLGGSEFDAANAVAIDGQGFIYLAGQTFSRNFPVSNAAQPACVLGPRGSCSDAFVAKIDPSGPRLVWATYLGRSFSDSARAIAVGADGSVAVTGSIEQTVFVARFSPDGALIYWQQFGRFAVNIGHAIALDAEGNAYVAGQTMDPNFPVTAGAFQPSAGPPSCSPIGGGSLLLDAFAMKLSPSGALLYSTFLGGSGNDRALGVSVDAAGQAWIAGTTGSSDFPVVGGLQAANAGGAPQGDGVCEGGDAFVARLGADGSTLGFSTYLGGPGADVANGIALDSLGNAHITGRTAGIPSLDLGSGGFTAKIDAASPRLVYAVSGGGTAIALDPAGNAFAGDGAATVLRIDPAGVPALYYAASFSGLLHALAVDKDGAVYLAGDARESLPVQQAIQTESAGNADAYVMKLSAPPPRLLTADGALQGPAAAVALHIQQDGTRRAEPTFFCTTPPAEGYSMPICTTTPARPVGSGNLACSRLSAGPGRSSTMPRSAMPGECRNVPIDPGPEGDQVILLLFGTGFRDARSATATIGGIDAEVLGVAAQPEFPGLDQANLRLPRELAGRGEVDVQLTLDGRPANVVTVAVR